MERRRHEESRHCPYAIYFVLLLNQAQAYFGLVLHITRNIEYH